MTGLGMHIWCVIFCYNQTPPPQKEGRTATLCRRLTLYLSFLSSAGARARTTSLPNGRARPRSAAHIPLAAPSPGGHAFQS